MFEIRKDTFYLDGKPFRVFSGAMHYFRVLPEYWEDRLKKLKALGMNCVETVKRKFYAGRKDTFTNLTHVRRTF